MRIAIAYGDKLTVGLLFFLLNIQASGQTPRTASQPPVSTAAAQPSAGGELGSTMTLEELEAKPARAAAQAEVPIEVRPAAEPVPALKYRFMPPLRELKPDSALMHYSRAILMFNQLPLELRRKVDAGQDDPKPSAEDIEALLLKAAPMFNELHQLALSEDFQWDHRIRDLRGAAVWSYLLPEIQEGRSLVRLLRRRIDDQLARNDFDGALSSIGDGYRLAEFISNGETLIEQLVGLAIADMMREAVQAAIAKPGCPNLYWALASVPRDLVKIRRAFAFELSWFDNVFEMLREAETSSGDERYWQSRLQALLTTLRQVTETHEDLAFSITLAAMTASPLAKQQLIEAGWKKEDVEAMPPTRALLINARRELRNWGDQLEKSILLPSALATGVSEQVIQEFDRWTAENRYSSLGASIAALLFPGVDAARMAAVRQHFQHDRLMVLEALRMHAATHHGQLPKNLADLQPVPAPLNPFNNQPFEYKAKATDGGVSVELSGELPPRYDVYKQLNITFKDATLAP